MGTETIKLDGAVYIGDEKVAELPIKLTKFQFVSIEMFDTLIKEYDAD